MGGYVCMSSTHTHTAWILKCSWLSPVHKDSPVKYCDCSCSYAVADNAYQTMLADCNNHFILISGESGAGKTEASKKILQFYAVSCPGTTLLNTVKDKMLMSNPVLEVRWLLHVTKLSWNFKVHDAADTHRFSVWWVCVSLQAFGNAKTLKNDNSSRFGKYMDIQFDSQVSLKIDLNKWINKN